MVIRVGAVTVVAGITMLAMAWLDPLGPLLVIVGAITAAIGLDELLHITASETALDAEADERSRLNAA